MKRIAVLAPTALAVALAVAACGSGSKAASPTPGPASSVGAAAPGATSAPEVSAAGDIPDNQAFVAYAPPAGGFSVKVPEGWARTESGGVVTFTDKLNSIRIQSQPAPSAPTVASAQQGEVPAISAMSAHYQPGKVTAITRNAGPAVLITYQADSAADRVTTKVVALDVERYEFWRNGTEVVLTLSAPHGADNVDPWRTVTDSFGWK
ncbi:MAG: hypothetical protein M3Y04_03960 [Actinomycetota bacterium]|nr:hypothetical protein [Actinomycetota bacterium]